LGAGTETTTAGAAGETITGAGMTTADGMTATAPRQRHPHQALAGSAAAKLMPTVSARTVANQYATFICATPRAG